MDDISFPPVKSCNEISILFILDYLLKLEENLDLISGNVNYVWV